MGGTEDCVQLQIDFTDISRSNMTNVTKNWFETLFKILVKNNTLPYQKRTAVSTLAHTVLNQMWALFKVNEDAYSWKMVFAIFGQCIQKGTFYVQNQQVGWFGNFSAHIS